MFTPCQPVHLSAVFTCPQCSSFLLSKIHLFVKLTAYSFHNIVNHIFRWWHWIGRAKSCLQSDTSRKIPICRVMTVKPPSAAITKTRTYLQINRVANPRPLYRMHRLWYQLLNKSYNIILRQQCCSTVLLQTYKHSISTWKNDHLLKSLLRKSPHSLSLPTSSSLYFIFDSHHFPSIPLKGVCIYPWPSGICSQVCRSYTLCFLNQCDGGTVTCTWRYINLIKNRTSSNRQYRTLPEREGSWYSLKNAAQPGDALKMFRTGDVHELSERVSNYCIDNQDLWSTHISCEFDKSMWTYNGTEEHSCYHVFNLWATEICNCQFKHKKQFYFSIKSTKKDPWCCCGPQTPWIQFKGRTCQSPTKAYVSFTINAADQKPFTLAHFKSFLKGSTWSSISCSSHWLFESWTADQTSLIHVSFKPQNRCKLYHRADSQVSHYKSEKREASKKPIRSALQQWSGK